MCRAIPVLRNRQEIAIRVVIEGDHSSKSVRDGCNVTPDIVADRNIIAVAIGGADESTFVQTTISPSLLVSVTNVLVIELRHEHGYQF